MISPSDEDLALFAKIPRSRLEAIVALTLRTPDEYERDTVALLELAEKLNLPGQIDQSLCHDGRGRVGAVKHNTQWHRQGKRKIA